MLHLIAGRFNALVASTPSDLLDDCIILLSLLHNEEEHADFEYDTSNKNLLVVCCLNVDELVQGI